MDAVASQVSDESSGSHTGVNDSQTSGHAADTGASGSENEDTSDDELDSGNATDAHTNGPDESTDGAADDSDDETSSTASETSTTTDASDSSEPNSPCQPNPCEHGTCEEQADSYSCECFDGYDGDECENNINDCNSNQCEHGTCVDLVEDYECDCGSSGYAGDFCEVEIQTCAETPCSNDGECTDEGNTRTCDCTGTGYEGVNCTTDIDECDDSPCDALTQCTNTPGAFSCSACPSGYTGTGETGCIDVDECLTNNGGCDALTLCTDTDGGRMCGACFTGYSGTGTTGCVNIDDCDPNPCRNGGSCTDGVDSYSCSCPSPWSGTICGNATLTTSATARGYYSSLAGLVSGGNTLTGTIGAEWSYHSFFVFSVPNFTGTVSSVTLKLEHESYASLDVSETFAVFDVSTSGDVLTELDGDQLEVFDDLGSGTQYGSFTLSAATVGSVRTIALSGAVSDVSSARGTDFAVGVRCQSIPEEREQYARFSGSDEARTHQLEIVVVP